MQALRSYSESAGNPSMQQAPEQVYRLWRSVMSYGGHDAVGNRISYRQGLCEQQTVVAAWARQAKQQGSVQGQVCCI